MFCAEQRIIFRNGWSHTAIGQIVRLPYTIWTYPKRRAAYKKVMEERRAAVEAAAAEAEAAEAVGTPPERKASDNSFFSSDPLRMETLVS